MPDPLTDADFDSGAHVARLKEGALLLARDMADANFNSTVVLVCRHGPEGSYGLVLNRPSHMPLSEIFDRPPGWTGSLARGQKIFIGGPVQPEELQILRISNDSADTPSQPSRIADTLSTGRPESVADGTHDMMLDSPGGEIAYELPQPFRVAPGVFLGGSWDNVEDILDADPKTTLLFLGYSGWGAEQLAKEVELQAWEVWNVDVRKFLLELEEAWMGDLGRIKSFLSAL